MEKTEINEKEIDTIFQATRSSDKSDVEELQATEDHNILQQNAINLINDDLILNRYINPPMRNLCFSNAIVTCLVNIPILRKYLQEARSDAKEKKVSIQNCVIYQKSQLTMSQNLLKYSEQ